MPGTDDPPIDKPDNASLGSISHGTLLEDESQDSIHRPVGSSQSSVRPKEIKRTDTAVGEDNLTTEVVYKNLNFHRSATHALDHQQKVK